jgi:hypothetical protein
MMNQKHVNQILSTSVKFLALTIILIGFLTGCSKLFSFFEQAPLEDGLYLSYYVDEYWVTIEFSKIKNNKYYASQKFEYEDEELNEYTQKPKRVIVNKRLVKENDVIYMPSELGPVWTAPSTIKPGGSIHGTYIDEVKKWKDWDVGVVKAGFGVGGAITGVWYYDKNTGFLVGGAIGTVMEIKPMEFELVETNLSGLMP